MGQSYFNLSPSALIILYPALIIAGILEQDRVC